MKEIKQIGNGSMKLPLTKKKYYKIYGGPYLNKPENMLGVKMAAEIAATHAVNIPTQDFQVPDRKTMYRGLAQALDLILKGEPLYVGCMGGMGRTGLFLATLAKVFGVPKPVEYVRANYYAKAVETEGQKKFVKDFLPTPHMRLKIKKARRKHWYKIWQRSLTKPV